MVYLHNRFTDGLKHSLVISFQNTINNNIVFTINIRRPYYDFCTLSLMVQQSASDERELFPCFNGKYSGWSRSPVQWPWLLLHGTIAFVFNEEVLSGVMSSIVFVNRYMYGRGSW